MVLAGWRFVVTGGAGGIGEAVVRRAVQAGARVLIADLHGQAARDLAVRIDPGGTTVGATACDVTKVEDCERLVLEAEQFFDGPMANGMSPEQMLLEVRLPRWLGGRVGSAFEEVSIRHGDYAIVAAAAQSLPDLGILANSSRWSGRE